MKLVKSLIVSTMFLSGVVGANAQSPDDKASFFITSVGLGKGGDLGGLEGADAHCGRLAQKAELPKREWRAYLSTQNPKGGRGESARHRIGKGPWYNVKGVMIAEDVNRLHVQANIFSDTALDENGRKITGVDEFVAKAGANRHDILTGSPKDGLAFWRQNPKEDRTCSNWTSSGQGSAIVGHHDRVGAGHTSWVEAHKTLGCSQKALKSSGGDGLFYCFAND